MPTDGTIFLEALPKRNHYLLTALSVFFAAGSVVSSIMGLLLIPRNSCGGAQDCNVADNKGWRWLLASLGFFVSRNVERAMVSLPRLITYTLHLADLPLCRCQTGLLLSFRVTQISRLGREA